VACNLIDDRRATEEQAAKLLTAMRAAFDGAEVPEHAIARLESAMTNDAKDRHVLAAAVASDAQAIVTLNLKHFPPEACEPFAIGRCTPMISCSTFASWTPRQWPAPSSAKRRFLGGRR
jgi:hypothetical protein